MLYKLYAMGSGTNDVQQTTNALLKLASDMGSIYSIVSAADANSQVSLESKKVYDLINGLVNTGGNGLPGLTEVKYATEQLNQLSNLISLKKSENPLISDDLVNMVMQACKDANSVLALYPH